MESLEYVDTNLPINTVYYFDSNLTQETTYYYKIASVNGMGTGPFSDPISVTTPTLKPNAINDLTVENITTSSIKISWSILSNLSNRLSGYIIYRSLTDTDYEVIGTITTFTRTDYTDSGLTPGTIYYYKVAARNSYGDSPLSTAVSVSTLPLIQMTERQWAEGNLPTQNSEQWFSFTATASAHYIHVSYGSIGDQLYIQYFANSLFNLLTKSEGSFSFTPSTNNA